MLVLFVATNEYQRFLYPTGLVLLSLATAVAATRGRFGKLLGVEPLRWLGVRSYGIYL